MSDVHHPARVFGDRRSAVEPQMTLPPTGPQRPEAGSPLERVLRRQSIVPAPRHLLGFVPAQVR